MPSLQKSGNRSVVNATSTFIYVRECLHANPSQRSMQSAYLCASELPNWLDKPGTKMHIRMPGSHKWTDCTITLFIVYVPKKISV